MLLALAAAARAEGEWTVMVVPSLMSPKVSMELPGAQGTVLVPARMHGDEPVAASAREFAATTREAVMESTRALASERLPQMKPEYFRTKKGVLQYATLTGDALTASVIFAPGFLRMFAETLGPKLLVAIPDRETVVVFPRLASDYRDYAGAIIARYKGATYPGSLEVFEVSEAGVRAVGAYELP